MGKKGVGDGYTWEEKERTTEVEVNRESFTT